MVLILNIISASAQDPSNSIPSSLSFGDTDPGIGTIGGTLSIYESKNPFYARYINYLSPGLSLDNRIFEYYAVYTTNSPSNCHSSSELISIIKFNSSVAYPANMNVTIPQGTLTQGYIGVATVDTISASGTVISSNCTVIRVIDVQSEFHFTSSS